MKNTRNKILTGISATLVLLLCAPLLTSAAQKAKKDDGLSIPEVTKDKVICFALYTVQDKTLKLTAQLYPLADDAPRTVRLEAQKNGQWREVAKTQIVNPGWTATFRVENWDTSKDTKYRVAHGKTAFYTGTVRKDPINKSEIVVAAFTGNSINPAHGGDLDKSDLLENVRKIQPDLLFFSGDQVYSHTKHYAAWLRFGRDFGDIIKDYPTITIPDDHDVGQPNLWGESGKQALLGGAADGGYLRPPEYVQEVERAQTSHLPDPYDPTPVERGIGVYYTDINIGRVSFAIIEDRKFKTGPAGRIPEMGPRPDHITDPNYDPSTIDVPDAILLGKRQLDFLDAWGKDWAGADMKAVLSQTVFAGVAHLHGSGSEKSRLHADMDSNGWPQTGRNHALEAIRKSFSFMLCGDQHLATVVHHGIDAWNDSGWSFCVPSIANLYPRYWDPLEPGKNRNPELPPYTGEFLDGFDNKINVYAAANPKKKFESGYNKLADRAAGWGIVRFNLKDREITMECWPRNTDVTGPTSNQYPGWPITIKQEDNYGRKAVAYLPTLKFKGQKSPVVQIIDESSGETVYTIRAKGASYRPKVFKKTGAYTILVGEGKDQKTLKGVKSIGLKKKKTIDVN